MSKIKIKNFGPIKEGYLENDGFLDIKKVTVFIGNQGSGKSTVAKVISTLLWMEKALNRDDFNGVSSGRIKKLLEYQGVLGYLYRDTWFDFHGDRYSFQYWNNHPIPQLQKIDDKGYITPKIMYVPAERNTISTISNIKGIPDNLLTFYEELRRANKELKGEKLKLPINNYRYEYNDQTETSYIIGPDYKVDIKNASSGAQSFTPLYLVTQNLALLVTQSDEILRKSMKADSILRMNEEMAALEVNDSISENKKIEKRKEIKAKYFSKCFINIVEEPEQNLYPSSQQNILNSLLEFNNLSEGNKLIMTTHSPYIISYLSLAIQADYLKKKIKSKDLLKKLEKVVPLNSTISADDVVIYQLNEKDGSIKKLPNIEGIPSDKNLLNKSLAEGNELFDLLLEIEQEL